MIPLLQRLSARLSGELLHLLTGAEEFTYYSMEVATHTHADESTAAALVRRIDDESRDHLMSQRS